MPRSEGRFVDCARHRNWPHLLFWNQIFPAMGATVSSPDGENVPVHMGSYGIGVSRLIGGIIEANHDDKGIVWPDSVAPFGVAVVNLKPGHDVCDKACQSLYDELVTIGMDPTLDDRDERGLAQSLPRWI